MSSNCWEYFDVLKQDYRKESRFQQECIPKLLSSVPSLSCLQSTIVQTHFGTRHTNYYIWGLIGVLSNCWGPIKDTKRTRGRLDRNAAPCSRPMSSAHSMNARKCVHECKKVCPCTKALPQSGIRAWIKQGRRKRKRETGKAEARRLMERKAAQQIKTHLRN